MKIAIENINVHASYCGLLNQNEVWWHIFLDIVFVSAVVEEYIVNNSGRYHLCTFFHVIVCIAANRSRKNTAVDSEICL